MSQMSTDPSQLVRRGFSVRGLANWILDYADSRSICITNMALNKLLYFVYERILVENGEIMTNAKIEAWEHGPVFREVYHDFKKFEDKPITTRARFFSVEKMREEIVVLNLDDDSSLKIRRVLDPLIDLSASRLRNLSHVEGGAWDHVWSHEGRSNPGMEIRPDVILAANLSQGVHRA